MISLVPVQLGAEPSTAATSNQTTPAPALQKISVQAMTGWNALLIGIVTGFAMSAGTLVFNKLAKRMSWL